MLIKLIFLLGATKSIYAGWFDLFSFGETSPSNVTTTYLTSALPYGKVELICSKSKKERVYQWRRMYNRRLPKEAFQDKGKLIIPHVSSVDSGRYYCGYETVKGIKIKVIDLKVQQRTPAPTFYDVATNNEFPNDLPQCDNDTLQSGSQCLAIVSSFECNDGQKVNRSLRCNRKIDCNDGSDEINCEFWPPKITMLPERKVDMYCGTQDDDKFDMLRLECEFVGHPEPLVKWKKYEGHVPSKCKQISVSGHGILLCPDFKQSDQGAYSCVAENSIGSSESQPKSIAKCKNSIPCNGFKVTNEEEIEHCLDCYCSGKTNKCQNLKSKLTSSRISLPNTVVTLYATDEGKIVPNQIELLNEVKYYELSKNALVDNSLLKSYGRNMRVPRYARRIEYLAQAPDLIMEGNGVTLYYNFHVISPSSRTIDVRFWPGNWHHLNRTVASRRDLMTVLANVDRILFRCEYVEGDVRSWASDDYLNLESSAVGDFSTSVSYVEKCTCPEGYSGLSCESCATGYERKKEESGIVCEKIQCDSKKGYFLSGNECVKSPCNVNGSLSLFPDFEGKCKCKDGATGDTCDQQMSCEAGYFGTGKSNECIKCWCSGVTDQCNGSSLHRTEISSLSMGGYNSSNGRNFWLLPAIFGGNKLTSYGGHIKYALTYSSGIPKQNEALSVELLTVNDVTLTFTHVNVDKSTTADEKVWIVPLKESYWRKSDKNIANRSEFLTVLKKLKAVYVESPYHLSSGNVNLTWVRMSDAKHLDNGANDFALEVEQCVCPDGYTGLSCESCAEGYYREKSSNQCVKCYCENCDPIEGCLGCPVGYYRDNPSTESRPLCKPCECNGREVRCGKDSTNTTYCICKSGFTGLNCENSISFLQRSSALAIKISPSKLINDVVSTETTFNCSYHGGEKLKMSFMKIYRDRAEGPFSGTIYPPLYATTNGEHEETMSIAVVLDEDLIEVECFVHNMNGKEVGRVLATVQTTGMQPVKITNCYSDYTYVKETKSKDFICQTTGSPRPTTTWYMKKPNEPREEVDSIDGVHSIAAVELSQNGTIFTCEAVNSVGDKDICTTVLVVEKNCDVVHISPKGLVVVEGDTIHFQCTTTANNRVSWSRTGSVLPLFRTYEYNGNLTIVNATLDDAGNYTCQTLSSDNRHINQTTWVNVTEKLISPTIFISSDDVTLDIGQFFTVNCWATGKPAPKLTWTKVSGSPSRNVYSYDGNLTVADATLEDTGIYECKAESKAGTEIGRIFIDVKERQLAPKLEVFPTTFSPVEGQSLRIECRVVSGQPKPTVEWFRDVVRSRGEFAYYQNGSVLQLHNISRYDSGIYQCRGYNSVGTDVTYVEINVMFVPEITVSKESVSVYENDEISVKCSAVGNPRPKIVWISQTKGNQKRDVGENDVLADLYLKAPEIAITVKASSDLYGLVCVASNEAGETRKVIPISVLPELVVYEEDVQWVPLGSYHELLCRGCSGKLKWEKSNGHLVGDECEIPNGLMIPSVQIQHNSTYVCTCTADEKFKKVFQIFVTGYVPKFTQDPKSYVVLPLVIDTNSSTTIEISFKTNRESGLLLKDEYNRFALYIQNNKTSAILYPEGGKRHHVVSSVDLQFGVWYSLGVEISAFSGKMTIYNAKSFVLETKEEKFKNFAGKIFSTSENNFFVGGAKHKPKNEFVHYILPHIPSLDGCISRLNINGRPYDFIRDSIYSTSVSLCNRCSEPSDPCKNNGKCLDAPTQFGFICVCPEQKESAAEVYVASYDSENNVDTCPPSCFGKNCDRHLDLCRIMNPCNRNDLNICSNKISSLSCSCSLGYHGLLCEREELSSFCAKGNGYVKLHSKHLPRPVLGNAEIIQMEFTTEKQKGLLLWRGDAENHIAITVNRGYVKYVCQNQGVLLSVAAQQKISLNESHTLVAIRTNNEIALNIDSVYYVDHSKFTTNRVTGNIYLGGAPQSILPQNFKSNGLFGCVHSVSFGNQPRINFREDVLEAVNIKQLKPRIYSNNLRDNLNYDKIESESVSDDDQSGSDYL